MLTEPLNEKIGHIDTGACKLGVPRLATLREKSRPNYEVRPESEGNLGTDESCSAAALDSSGPPSSDILV